MESVLFRFDDYAGPEEAFHVVSKTLDPEPPALPHRHDYYEVALVAEGEARHYTEAGEQRLSPGDLLTLRPCDVHWLASAGGVRCRILNVSFRQASADHLLARYGADLSGRLFWSEGPTARPTRLAGPQREQITRATNHLRQGPRSLMRIERYLLMLAAELSAGEDPPDVPSWLAAACRAARAPEVFRQGGAGLVSAAGRGHEHVCRQMKRHFGVTPTQYVNRIRIEHAAMLLSSSDSPLERIAAICGFEGQGHFHRLFRAHYGATPGSLRRRAGDPVQSGEGAGA